MTAVQPSLNSERRRALAEGAVRLLAQQGARGLTHRRLDNELGLPEGSTSNAFSTRGALFSAALVSLAEPELTNLRQAADHLPTSTTPTDAAGLFAHTVFFWLEPDQRPRLKARFELILESARQPALQQILGELRAAFTDIARRLASAAGATDPDTAGTLLVSLADGILIAHLSGQIDPPRIEQVSAAAQTLLAS